MFAIKETKTVEYLLIFVILALIYHTFFQGSLWVSPSSWREGVCVRSVVRPVQGVLQAGMDRRGEQQVRPHQEEGERHVQVSQSSLVQRV